MSEKFSATLRIGDLNDYIAPSQGCVIKTEVICYFDYHLRFEICDYVEFRAYIWIFGLDCWMILFLVNFNLSIMDNFEFLVYLLSLLAKNEIMYEDWKYCADNFESLVCLLSF